MISTAFAVARPPFTVALQAPPAKGSFGPMASGQVNGDGRHAPTIAESEPAFRMAQRGGQWMAQMLDEVDYAMLLIGDAGGLIHANAATRAALHGSHPLELQNGALRARAVQDRSPLLRALHGAVHRGVRSLVTLRGAEPPVSVAVVPLRTSCTEGGSAALVMLGRESLGQHLSTQWFGRCHGLTSTESQVLQLLCEGLPPSEVANRQGVAKSTIRTQIASIRGKTGAHNIRALLCQIALLPPLVGVLR